MTDREQIESLYARWPHLNVPERARLVTLLKTELEQAERKGKEAYDWAMHEKDVQQHRAEQAERERDEACDELERSPGRVELSSLEVRLAKAEDELSDLAVFTAEETGRLRDANLRLAKVPAFVEAAREVEARRKKWSKPGELPFPIATALDKLANTVAAWEQE